MSTFAFVVLVMIVAQMLLKGGGTGGLNADTKNNLQCLQMREVLFVNLTDLSVT